MLQRSYKMRKKKKSYKSVNSWQRIQDTPKSNRFYCEKQDNLSKQKKSQIVSYKIILKFCLSLCLSLSLSTYYYFSLPAVAVMGWVLRFRFCFSVLVSLSVPLNPLWILLPLFLSLSLCLSVFCVFILPMPVIKITEPLP